MKTIYHIRAANGGEMDFFFDAKGKMLTWWDLNDANYRDEYMNDLFKKLGYEVKTANQQDKRFAKQIKQVFLDCGATEADFV